MQNSLEGEGPWENGEGPEVPQLGAAGRKTSSAFGYAQRQDLIINIKDVAWENGSWDKHLGHLEHTVLEIFFTDYVLTPYVLCWPYTLSSLFLLL